MFRDLRCNFKFNTKYNFKDTGTFTSTHAYRIVMKLRLGASSTEHSQAHSLSVS